MGDLFTSAPSPTIQLLLWLIAGIIGLTVGPGCWKTYKTHVDQLQEMIDDYENENARLRGERDKLRDDLIATEMKIYTLIAYIENNRLPDPPIG